MKAQKVGVPPTEVFSTLQLYLGSQYVNDFNYLGRTYKVVAQGDGPFRPVLFGMLGVTAFGLLFTPAFYTFILSLGRGQRS